MITPPLKHFDLVIVDFGAMVDSSSVQFGIRPALVLQPTAMNTSSTTTIVCPLASVKKKLFYPYHIELGKRFGLRMDSIALLEQISVIDQSAIIKHIGHIEDTFVIARIYKGLRSILGIPEIDHLTSEVSNGRQGYGK